MFCGVLVRAAYRLFTQTMDGSVEVLRMPRARVVKLANQIRKVVGSVAAVVVACGSFWGDLVG